jgi:hypothetical protein
MKKILVSTLILAGTLTLGIPLVFGWGTWGHNYINKGAIMALPKEMGMFFYNHADFITEESNVPDIRKHTMNDKAEAARHYIDLERFHYKQPSGMPRTMDDAIAKYGKDSLNKFGILPWYIQEMMVKLTEAFKNKRKAEILFLAADLGHYIGDAHMPLHTSINHDGQLTGQQGIHAFWESQLPEIYGKNYRLYTGNVHYITDIEKATWNIIDSSHRLAEDLLGIEYKMKKDNPEEKQYIIGPDGEPAKSKYGQPIHTPEYAHIYHELLNGMVERQMRLAIEHTTDFWYTAWVNAGKPDLADLDPDYITERNKPLYKEDEKAFKKKAKPFIQIWSQLIDAENI